MKTKHYLTLISTALVLAACGGGGGGSPNIASTNTGTGTNQSGTNTGSNPATGTEKSGFFGQAAAFNDTANIRKITVAGKTIDLIPAGASMNNDFNIKNHGFNVGGNRFWDGVDAGIVSKNGEHVVAGIVNVDGKATAFYNGNLSQSVPTGGVVQYKTAIVRTDLNGQNMSINGSSAAGSVLKADFGTKKVEGRLLNFDINADIKGSTFQSARGAATEVKGGFYGNNAAEIGGIVKQGNTMGAFVGKRQ